MSIVEQSSKKRNYAILCSGSIDTVNDGLNQRDLQILKEKQEKEECELFIQNLNEKIETCKKILIPIMGEEYLQRFI
jgi:hypothetical protein